MRKKLFTTLLSFMMVFSTFITNPLVINAEGGEWQSTSKLPGTISEKIVEGVRYWELAATGSHDNAKNRAIFEPAEAWVEESMDVNRSFNFVPVANADQTRFGVHLFYLDADNNLSVGYDAGGWFWEYKVDGSGNYYKKGRVKGPQAGDQTNLRFSLKDNKFMAWTTVNGGQEQLLFDEMFDANIIENLFAKSQKTVVRLSGWGGSGSKIMVKAEDQTNITLPQPDFDRPELDRYEDYEVVYDFEGNSFDPQDDFKNVNGSVERSLVEADGNTQLKLDFNDKDKQIVSLRKTPLLENFVMEADLILTSEMKRFGFAFRAKDKDTFATVMIGDAMNQYFTEHFGKDAAYSEQSVGLEMKANQKHHWKVQVLNNTITLHIDDQVILENTMDNLPGGASEFGFVKSRGAGSVLIDNLKLTKITPDRPGDANNEGVVFDTLSNDAMSVEIDKGFPRVKAYTLASGKMMDGQPTKIETVKINGIDLIPEVTYQKVSNDKADYTLKLTDGKNINVTLQSSLEIKNNTLTYKITEVNNHNTDQSDNSKIVRTIEIPNHSLVSVKSSENNANIMGSVVSTNTTVSGDTLTKVDSKLRNLDKNYAYAFVSNDEVSAGMHSNSQFSNGNVRDFGRINARAKEFTTYNSVGLQSSPWIYHKDVMFDAATTTELPVVTVALTEDQNDDNTVDWQDGAIAFRDIMYSPIGAEQVKDLVAYRIAMNFGSHAQNPFLMTLDGIKKVNLHTDGLGQSVLLKGYGSEGHDSGHLNYADIGMRMGGVEEFQYLLNESVKYGTSVGIHVNASETYPESKYFTEDRLLKNADGSYKYGWNWIDQGINIDAAYDLANGRRERFEDLRNAITETNLGWIYVDVWGNGQSGDNGAWASHQLAKEIHDQGWRLGGEWGYAFEPDSTFQHWSTDLTYGGYTLKGFNSSVMRFIFNHQRDAWVADYPKYSGAADYPLLGGYNMKDFEGWQGRNDYNGYMTNLFEHNIPAKYLQHFEVNRWIDGTPVSMKNPDGAAFEWTPEMEVGLINDEGQKITIKRGSNDYKNNYEGYRSRTIELDGRLILNSDTYLLPWNWDENGNALTGSDQKLYHFNKQGGTTTWTLPSDWNQGSVMFYELSETGNKLVKEVAVENGEVSLDAEANKGYVLYQGEKEVRKATYGEGAHIVDPGFNSQVLDAWTVEGDGVSITKSQASNDMLTLKDNSETAKVSQTLTDLEPGESYVAYVGVDNRSNSKAILELNVNGELLSNYTDQSIAKNYVKAYAHNTNSSTINKNSYFQNLFVYFTAPASGEVNLSMIKEAGEGVAFFDDVRITKNTGNPYNEDGSFFQDFENSAQGIFPFVVGNIEGVEDNRTHLSQLNAPYTQRGWNDKKVNDVIGGEWSLKTNGLTQRNKIVYQTIPQNIRFESGKEYTISFDYEAGSDGTYALIIGDGEVNGSETLIPLDKTIDKDGPQTYTFTLKGAESNQSWFGIYSTSQSADTEGTASNGDVNFRGYKDIILDNIAVQEVKPVELQTSSGYSLLGSGTFIQATDTLKVSHNDSLKQEVEAKDSAYDVDALDIHIMRGEDEVVIPEGQTISFKMPVRTQKGLRAFFAKAETVKAVYTMNEDGSLSQIAYVEEDGQIKVELDSLSSIIVDYGKAVDPVDPDPVDPVDPDPVDPVDPDPVDPVDPDPVDPVDPDPVDPDPVDPVDPNPVDPVDPNPVDPVVPVKPVEPSAGSDAAIEDGKEDLPATGVASTPIIPVMGMTIAAAGIAIVLKKRKEQE